MHSVTQVKKACEDYFTQYTNTGLRDEDSFVMQMAMAYLQKHGVVSVEALEELTKVMGVCITYRNQAVIERFTQKVTDGLIFARSVIPVSSEIVEFLDKQ